MSSTRRCVVALTLVAALPGASRVWGQTLSPQLARRMDTNAAEVAVLLRTKGHAGSAVTVLTQTPGSQPPQKLDEIADTLMRVAMASIGNDSVPSGTRVAALSALIEAGLGQGGFIRDGMHVAAGKPYAGAISRLMRIVETAPDPTIRSTTLAMLADFTDTPVLLPFFRRIAMSEDHAAWQAIVVLNEATGPEGLKVLAELYDQRLVVEPHACELLESIAKKQRWPEPAVPLEAVAPRPRYHSILQKGPC